MLVRKNNLVQKCRDYSSYLLNLALGRGSVQGLEILHQYGKLGITLFGLAFRHEDVQLIHIMCANRMKTVSIPVPVDVRVLAAPKVARKLASSS